MDTRKIFTHGSYGVRQLQEALSSLMVGLILSPDSKDIWLVSPYISDFELLDNRSGDWDCINPVWGLRYVTFSELLITAVEVGCKLRFISTKDPKNLPFIRTLESRPNITTRLNMNIHTKGLLCSSFFLSGSMNFTYVGTSNQDNLVNLSKDRAEISQARIEFEDRYSGS